MIAAIVAVDGNNGIGFNGELLEHIPEDMKRFRELTTNHIVVMGHKTWDSLPNKPLTDRLNLVITSGERQYGEGTCFIGMTEAIVRLGHAEEDEEWFIIGGGSIYEQLLPYCDTVYMTRIDVAHENVDTYFPHLDLTEWSLTEWSDWQDYNGIPYRFLTYKRA